MSLPILEISDLDMVFGKTVALNDLSLSVNRGDIYGLIGPNGAGKTTTFRIVATILRPTRGYVGIDGIDLTEKSRIREIRRKIGYMPDTFGVYEDMTVEEYLTFFAAAYDITNPRRQRLVDDVLELVDLAGKRKSLIETLSRGMQQRLGIARVLIHDPELLILDEPASGLDPRARIEIRSLLLELQKMGKTVFISSHILADLGEICTRVGIIEKGKLVVDGTLRDVLAMVKPSAVIYLRIAEDNERAIAVLPSYSEAYVALAVLYETEGRIEASHEALATAEELIGDRAILLMALARSYEQVGEFDVAMARVEEAILLEPDSAQAYLIRGGLEETLGDTAKAIDDFEHASTLASEQGEDALYVLARTRMAMLMQKGSGGGIPGGGGF